MCKSNNLLCAYGFQGARISKDFSLICENKKARKLLDLQGQKGLGRTVPLNTASNSGNFLISNNRGRGTPKKFYRSFRIHKKIKYRPDCGWTAAKKGKLGNAE